VVFPLIGCWRAAIIYPWECKGFVELLQNPYLSMRCSAPVHLSCESIADTTDNRLCAGVGGILAASCNKLSNHTWLTSAIGAIGLVPDTRRERLYGDAAVHMVSNRRAGLWQDPKQLASALIEATAHGEVLSYVELGVHTAWTACTVGAYLSRMTTKAFHGLAVDSSREHVAKYTADLLERLNMRFMTRNAFDMLLEQQPHLQPQQPQQPQQRAHVARLFDLCFIDADHDYMGVRTDYESLAPRCSTDWMMQRCTVYCTGLHL
jgi:hypothetical protein